MTKQIANGLFKENYFREEKSMIYHKIYILINFLFIEYFDNVV